MKSDFHELHTVLVGLFLSLGLSFNVFASTEVASTQEKISELEKPIPAVVSDVPLPTSASLDRDSTAIEEMPIDGGHREPPLSKQEINMFKQEMNNLSTDASQVFKDLKSAAASKMVDEWRSTLNSIISKASECTSRVKSGSSEEKREAMNECRSANLFNDVNDIRQQFVPPHEIKSILNDIKNQEKELLRFVKPLLKTGGPALEMIKKLQNDITIYRANITSATGQDQRDAMQEWWNARFWEEVNNVRAYAEIPKQLTGVTKDLAHLEKKIAKDSFKKAAAFLSLNLTTLTNNFAEKQKNISDINAALAKGDGESANDIMQESIHQGWHPGDLLGIVDMSSNIYRVIKNVKDPELKEQMQEILDPMIELVNEGEYRDAQQAFHQFQMVMHQYEENDFRQPTHSRLNSKISTAFDRLEQSMKKKFGTGASRALDESPDSPEDR